MRYAFLFQMLVSTLVFAGEPIEPSGDSSWAQPMEIPGVPNLHKVSDVLYRSAQPTAEGMANLKNLGVQTILNLRSFHSDRAEIGELGLGYEHLYMKAWHPEEKELVRFLQIVCNSKRTPVLVHCQHGADRTGVLCAVYRMAVQGWTVDRAIHEMKEGDYGFHKVWVHLEGWVRKLDIEAIRKRAGLGANDQLIRKGSRPRVVQPL